ncbi:hypothetical protein MHYP_G00235580 [Metynnis hypsauchen]
MSIDEDSSEEKYRENKRITRVHGDEAFKVFSSVSDETKSRSVQVEPTSRDLTKGSLSRWGCGGALCAVVTTVSLAWPFLLNIQHCFLARMSSNSLLKGFEAKEVLQLPD